MEEEKANSDDFAKNVEKQKIEDDFRIDIQPI